MVRFCAIFSFSFNLFPKRQLAALLGKQKPEAINYPIILHHVALARRVTTSLPAYQLAISN